MKHYPDGESMFSKKRFYNTGIFRCPKKGERYLSGAIVEAYIAPNDLTQEFYIAGECTVTITETVTPIFSSLSDEVLLEYRKSLWANKQI